MMVLALRAHVTSQLRAMAAPVDMTNYDRSRPLIYAIHVIFDRTFDLQSSLKWRSSICWRQKSRDVNKWTSVIPLTKTMK
jgi:hypothetical protein